MCCLFFCPFGATSCRVMRLTRTHTHSRTHARTRTHIHAHTFSRTHTQVMHFKYDQNVELHNGIHAAVRGKLLEATFSPVWVEPLESSVMGGGYGEEGSTTAQTFALSGMSGPKVKRQKFSHGKGATDVSMQLSIRFNKFNSLYDECVEFAALVEGRCGNAIHGGDGVVYSKGSTSTHVVYSKSIVDDLSSMFMRYKKIRKGYADLMGLPNLPAPVKGREEEEEWNRRLQSITDAVKKVLFLSDGRKRCVDRWVHYMGVYGVLGPGAFSRELKDMVVASVLGSVMVDSSATGGHGGLLGDDLLVKDGGFGLDRFSNIQRAVLTVVAGVNAVRMKDYDVFNIVLSDGTVNSGVRYKDALLKMASDLPGSFSLGAMKRALLATVPFMVLDTERGSITSNGASGLSIGYVFAAAVSDVKDAVESGAEQATSNLDAVVNVNEPGVKNYVAYFAKNGYESINSILQDSEEIGVPHVIAFYMGCMFSYSVHLMSCVFVSVGMAGATRSLQVKVGGRIIKTISYNQRNIRYKGDITFTGIDNEVPISRLSMFVSANKLPEAALKMASMVANDGQWMQGKSTAVLGLALYLYHIVNMTELTSVGRASFAAVDMKKFAERKAFIKSLLKIITPDHRSKYAKTCLECARMILGWIQGGIIGNAEDHLTDGYVDEIIASLKCTSDGDYMGRKLRAYHETLTSSGSRNVSNILNLPRKLLNGSSEVQNVFSIVFDCILQLDQSVNFKNISTFTKSAMDVDGLDGLSGIGTSAAQEFLEGGAIPGNEHGIARADDEGPPVLLGSILLDLSEKMEGRDKQQRTDDVDGAIPTHSSSEELSPQSRAPPRLGASSASGINPLLGGSGASGSEDWGDGDGARHMHGAEVTGLQTDTGVPGEGEGASGTQAGAKEGKASKQSSSQKLKKVQARMI